MEPLKMLDPIPEADRSTAESPALTVGVSIRFTDPVVRSVYTRSYASSPGFQASERHCHGLVRRIEHCCAELITREDSTALDAYIDNKGLLPPKPLRFRVIFRINLRDAGLWAERTFNSYQRRPLTVDSAREIVLATHRMAGLFLRYHDKGFRWIDSAFREGRSETPLTCKPALDDPLSLCCVPRLRFIESSQSWEFRPGFTVELSLNSRSRLRQQPEFRRTIRVNSRQSSPLTLFHSEDLLWQALRSVNASLDSLKRTFDHEHGSCDGLVGAHGCQHFDENALHLELRVFNNLGPVYDHLHRSIRSRIALFRDPEAQDCRNFARILEKELQRARDDVDSRIGKMDDFDLRIVELRGPCWTVQNPARFRLEPTPSYSYRSIEALLARVQTGIGDVLRGHNVAIHINAYKRGHLVLDKALVARESQEIKRESFATPEEQKAAFVDRLRDRIQRDIDMVCKDTCSIDDIPEGGDSKSHSAARDSHAVHALTFEVGEVKSTAAGTPPTQERSQQDSSHLRAFPLLPSKHIITSRVSSGSTLIGDLSEAPEDTSLTKDHGASSSPPYELDGRVDEAAEAVKAIPPTSEADDGIASRQGSAERTAYTEDIASQGQQVIDRMGAGAHESQIEQSGGEPALTATKAELGSVDDSHSKDPTLETGSPFATSMIRATTAEEDAESIPPSTPSLSSAGNSSRRNSLLMTPAHLQGLHDVKEAAFRVAELSCEFDSPGELIEIPASPDPSSPLTAKAENSASVAEAYQDVPETDVGNSIEGERTQHGQDLLSAEGGSATEARVETEAAGAEAALDDEAGKTGVPDNSPETDAGLVAVKLEGNRGDSPLTGMILPIESPQPPPLGPQPISDIDEEAASVEDFGEQDGQGACLSAAPNFDREGGAIASSGPSICVEECSSEPGRETDASECERVPDSTPTGLFEVSGLSTPITKCADADEQALAQSPTSLQHLVPASLLAPSPVFSSRSSRSGASIPYASEAEQDIGRGSIDDVPSLEDELSRSDDPESHFRPPTAGYLGLHETKLVEVGLRGALGGARRFSLPPQVLMAESGVPERPASSNSSTRGGDKKNRKKDKRPKSLGTLTPQIQTPSGGAEDGEVMLPRVMLIFAGMAVASKMMKGSA